MHRESFDEIERALKREGAFIPGGLPTAEQLLRHWATYRPATINWQISQLRNWLGVSLSRRTLFNIHADLATDKEAAA